MISKQQYEAQLRQIFKLLLENKTQDEIARELHIGVRTVSRYSQRIEKRYGQMQRQKTDNTLFLEAQLFKNRMLTLYKALENRVISSTDDDNINKKTFSGIEVAKCCEVAADIAIHVFKMESEGIKVVIAAKELLGVEKREAAISDTTATTTNMMYYDESEESC